MSPHLESDKKFNAAMSRIVFAMIGVPALFLIVACATLPNLPLTPPASTTPAAPPAITLSGAYKGFTLSVGYQF